MQMHQVLIGIVLGSYFGLLIALIYFLSKRVRLREHRKANGFFEEKLHMFFLGSPIAFSFLSFNVINIYIGFFQTRRTTFGNFVRPLFVSDCARFIGKRFLDYPTSFGYKS